MSYSNLLNLESLMSFRLHKPDAAPIDYGGGSPDESTSSQDEGAILDQCNGAISSSGPRKRKSRMLESEAYYADEGGKDYETRISEEEYRSMLGEHVQKYRRVKLKKSTPLSARVAVQVQKHGHEVKSGNFDNEPFISMKEELALLEMDISPEYNETEFDSAYLDIVDGVSYEIPQSYEKLTTSLKLPSISDLRVEEYYLNGTLDLPALATFVSSNRWSEDWNRGLGEPQPQYKSLQARLKALSASNSSQSFALQVCDIGLDPFLIPEGAAGRIPRWILSGSGTLELYYVKVREKGDTYEIIERSLPKKQIVEKDPSLIKEEELEKLGKLWVNIARRDISKHHKIFINFHRKKLSDAKRCSEICQKEVKWKVGRSLKLIKSASNRTRKLTRDMLIFWKRVDKEQAELRKIEERVAAEALKREEEAREAKRQRQRLNFLLSQTELYSHFMQNKSSQPSETLLMPASEEILVPVEIKPEEEDPEEAELRREALRAAQNAVFEQKKITSAFDSECLKLRQADEPTVPDDDPTISGSSNIDLLNPSTMPVTSSVQTPEMFKGTLKDYQLKGLQWLVNCYEQGLNGILADEMGLGKTIQAMAFLAHLAEEKNIWGPFLVVAPSSVLNNWSDEVSRFCPDLRTLPYWGELQARTILRKNIQPKRLYRRESGFHILITSYQLLVTDERYLRRVKWQYMVLDEAQAIKSSNSIRWKTLLSFNCRNRLLLTGTPIQNNMAELWALLHFIMPTLFDSHDQFNEWFSKGIESHAEHGGTLNEHQLNRLHAILKPFMLRRIKKDVITEMTSKTEVMVHCKLSSRQQAFYQAIKNKISLAELFDGSRGHLSEKKIVNLMNIVIQLRKVCNHPELFERNEGTSYFYFGEIPNSPLPPPFGELEDIHYAGNWNPITYKVPKLVYQDTIRSDEMFSVTRHGVRCGYFEKLFNIFSLENIFHSSVPHYKPSNEPCERSGAFGFTRLINLSPGETSYVATCSLLERLLFSVLMRDKLFMDETLEKFIDLDKVVIKEDHIGKGKVRAVSRMLLLPTKSNGLFRSLVVSQQDRFSSNIRLLRSTYSFIPRSRAPPINAQCPDRNFAYQMVEELHHPWIKNLFLGYACTSEFNGPRRPGSSHPLIQEIDSEPLVIQPALQLTYRIFGSSPPIRSFDPAKMLTDSGKLQTLDILLKRLRAENHRVLLFAQMTKMLNILEDYMNYRKYRYLRLDGSSSIMDRRDMVRDFQHRNDIFVFLLSTRAGGLGINLTAADTVIFYESDWNPTLDLQAMDRAHRLGQTKEVTVYRLICKETVEDKILQRASQKNTVQQLVMTGGHVQGDLLKTEDVVSLLLDDAQLEQKLREIPLSAKDPQKKKRAAKGIRVDANGDVRLEDFDRPNVENETAEHDNGTAINKKRKSDFGMQTAMKPPSKPNDDMLMDGDKPIPDEDRTNKSQRLKRRQESARAT